MKILLRFLGFLFAAGTIVFIVGVAATAGLLWHYSKDLPDYSQLQDYEPPVMTRVHAADGSLLAEYANQRRLYLPIQAIPKLVTNAFIAAEDKNFYQHPGIDIYGIARAGMLYVQNYGSSRRPQGASTITQQVAKNFLLTNEVSFERKIKEALLALRIERTYSKEKILELYLNEIYLGFGAYGVAAASLLYFDKSVHELSIAEAAYLAALPKGPNNYNPFRKRDEAIARRNYVIDRMAEDGYIPADVADKAKKEPLDITVRPTGAHVFAAEYFTEEVRRYIYDNYGEKKLYEGGLSVRTTLDPKIQVMARQSMINGLVNFDESQGGYRGPVTKIDISGDWGTKLADVKSLSDVTPWRMAVVLDVTAESARIGLQPGARSRRQCAQSPRYRHHRSRRREMGEAGGGQRQRPDRQADPGVSQVLAAGDVVYVEPLQDQGKYRLRQIPEISGAMVVMDPRTGRVLAMVGGFSFDQSQFNRATQALRQPGSSFKPLVYAAALDNGYTPSSIVMDAPIEIDMGQGGGIWKPENYGGKFYGPSTLRFGLEQSRNVMTVRLAQDIGMPLIAEYAKRFGVYDELPPYLSYALGAGETTVLRMVTAYSMFDNGGRRVKPTLVDRIQDRYGHTIYKHDERECVGCDAAKWDRSAGADIDRPPRAGDRSDDRLSDHLDDGRRRAARHRDRGPRRRQADRRQDRHHQRREGRVVHRLLAGHRVRRLYGLRQAAPYRPPGHRRPSRRAGRAGFPQACAGRQAADSVPRAARHQAHSRQSQDRHARRAGRRQGHPRSVQARHRAPRQLFGCRCGDREWRSAAGGVARRRPRHPQASSGRPGATFAAI